MSPKAKKILLSGAVVVTFVAYSFGQRHDKGQIMVVAHTTNQSGGNRSTVSAATNSNPAGSTNSPSSSPSTNQSLATYKDGKYTGSVADAFYGNIQVQATISAGKLTDVNFLQYPNDRENSIAINRQAMPYLRQEAITAQSPNVNVVTGATDTSYAFMQSLSAALNQAKK